MKKIILILGLLIFSIICAAQVQQKINSPYSSNERSSYYVPDYNVVEQVNITTNQIPDGNGWAQMGVSCAGCPSYYYKITRTLHQHQAFDGVNYYYFFFYFFSNSHYANANPASTYLKDVNFYLNQNLIFHTEYLLLPQGAPVYGAWMRSKDPNAIIQFTITQMTVQ
jgi:uncharacterized protein YxeA